MKSLLYLSLFLISNSVFAQSDFSPKFSPDGRQISYYQYIDGVPEIMIMNLDGTNKQQITPRTGKWSIGAIWSSNGNKIMFSYGNGMSDLDIAVIDVKSKEILTAQRPGSQFPLGKHSNGVLWANKDESTTTFFRSSNYFIKKKEEIKLEGFQNYWVNTVPGSYDLMMSVYDEGKEGIYKVSKDSEPKKILDVTNARSIVISRDGKKMAFEMKVDDNDDIYVSNIDGSNLKRMTTDEYPDYMPAFSPDGDKLVFSSARSGAYCIYMLDIKTMEITQLTGTQ